VQPAPAGNQIQYDLRRPEKKPRCIRWSLGHLESFLAQVEAETGASLPDFVKDEFDAFLECGILAHRFVRLRCARVGPGTHIMMSPLELMQRLAALVPRPRLHLIRFHGVLTPHAKLRAQIVPSAPLNANQACDHHAQRLPASPARMRLKPACSSA